MVSSRTNIAMGTIFVLAVTLDRSHNLKKKKSLFMAAMNMKQG